MCRTRALLASLCFFLSIHVSFGLNCYVDTVPELGLISISGDYFADVPGAVNLEIPNGNFENSKNDWPLNGWTTPSPKNITQTIATLTDAYQRVPKPAEIAYAMNITLGEYDYIFSRIKPELLASPWQMVTDSQSKVTLITANNLAPEGNNYLHLSGNGCAMLRSPDFQVKENKPHLLSLWVRSDTQIKTGPWFWFDVGLHDIKMNFHGLPNTKGSWKRVGIYFRAPSGVSKAHWTLSLESAVGKYVDIDDIQLRTASEQEFSAAYHKWRALMPANTTKSDKNDGQFLANSIAKLSAGKGSAQRPFLIWGVGSSWTYFQGDIETWRQEMLKEFPNAPEIIYKSKTGSGSPYDYARGWVETMVRADKPDLIFCYTNGSTAALEKMLADIRRSTTADIIIPSLHFFHKDDLDNDQEASRHNDTIAQICLKYKAQFVDNRNHLKRWLKQNNKDVTYLLFDAVHQTELGKLLINENIAAHFTTNAKKGYDERKLEREIVLHRHFQKNDRGVQFAGNWKMENGMMSSASQGSSIKYRFRGNRVDILGSAIPEGGTLKVMVDGIPAGQQQAYYISYVNPAFTNISHDGVFPRSSRGNADTGPHGIKPGSNIIPQQWTITMLNNQGDYKIYGSATGFDGNGNNRKHFRSNSGQIIIDPETWRHPGANIENDSWVFTVTPSASDTLSLETKSDERQLVYRTAIDQLSNEEHTIELILESNRPVKIRSIHIYTPMLKD